MVGEHQGNALWNEMDIMTEEIEHSPTWRFQRKGSLTNNAVWIPNYLDGGCPKNVKYKHVKHVPCMVQSILTELATAADKTQRIVGAKSAQGKKFKYQLR